MAQSNRSATGQFAPGGGGRPKGAKNRRKAYTPAEFSASVMEVVAAKLEGLMGKAFGVIEGQLDLGDARTAIWVLVNGRVKVGQRAAQMLPLLGLV